jgi:hypothetical protein
MSSKSKARTIWNAEKRFLFKTVTDNSATNSYLTRNTLKLCKKNTIDRKINTSTIVPFIHTKEYLQPRFVRRLTDAGDPISGANSFWIGHFQARARQLTS